MSHQWPRRTVAPTYVVSQYLDDREPGHPARFVRTDRAREGALIDEGVFTDLAAPSRASRLARLLTQIRAQRRDGGAAMRDAVLLSAEQRRGVGVGLDDLAVSGVAEGLSDDDALGAHLGAHAAQGFADPRERGAVGESPTQTLMSAPASARRVGQKEGFPWGTCIRRVTRAARSRQRRDRECAITRTFDECAEGHSRDTRSMRELPQVPA